MTALRDYIASVVSGEDPNAARTERIMLRMTPGGKKKLADLSEKLGKLPTPCAQELLDAAIEDAMNAMG